MIKFREVFILSTAVLASIVFFTTLFYLGAYKHGLILICGDSSIGTVVSVQKIEGYVDEYHVSYKFLDKNKIYWYGSDRVGWSVVPSLNSKVNVRYYILDPLISTLSKEKYYNIVSIYLFFIFSFIAPCIRLYQYYKYTKGSP